MPTSPAEGERAGRRMGRDEDHSRSTMRNDDHECGASGSDEGGCTA
jgi:hypothetical protein